LLGECRLLLSDVILQVSITDRWSWRLNTIGGYSVCNVYDMLSTDDNNVVDAASELIWHKHVSVYVYLLAW